MLKSIMILAALLVSPAALAADESTEDPGDGFEKSICDQIRPVDFTPASIAFARNQCLQSSNCVWDAPDTRCENNPAIFTGCNSVVDPLFCAQVGCIWDAQDPGGARCEPL